MRTCESCGEAEIDFHCECCDEPTCESCLLPETMLCPECHEEIASKEFEDVDIGDLE